jgi:hypothetical protein
MPLPARELATADAAGCASCGARNTVSVFPALFREGGAPARPETALDGEAACFDHAGKRAVAACQQCGRFVCQLCAVEFGGGVWCPSCVAAGSGQARAANPDASRVLYDSIALAAPIASLLVFWPITVLTAPGTLLFALVKWRQPLSLVHRGRWRFVAAILLSLMLIALWLWALVYFIERTSTGK